MTDRGGRRKGTKEFVRPFAASLEHAARRSHWEEYVTGLVSNVKRKNIETIAYLHEQDRQPLQKFIGQKPWKWQPMIGEPTRQIGATLSVDHRLPAHDRRASASQSVGMVRR